MQDRLRRKPGDEHIALMPLAVEDGVLPGWHRHAGIPAIDRQGRAPRPSSATRTRSVKRAGRSTETGDAYVIRIGPRGGLGQQHASRPFERGC